MGIAINSLPSFIKKDKGAIELTVEKEVTVYENDYQKSARLTKEKLKLDRAKEVKNPCATVYNSLCCCGSYWADSIPTSTPSCQFIYREPLETYQVISKFIY